MPLGFIILAHQELDRVAELAEHLVSEKCAIAIHIDRKVSILEYQKLQKRLSKHRGVVFSKRVYCEWGTFSLVKATQNAAEELLETFPTLEHIALISGSCLPIRPIRQFKQFLSRNKATDFIESVSIETERWVKGGLNEERFTLFFPFTWRRHRKLFNLSVKWQRKLKVSRDIPKGIKPHIGSQWWCLTRRTLEAILNDTNREDHDRYFAKSWIPDESYFQTLTRLHGERIESRSLTFARFDSQGKPFTIYDDHLDLMQKTDCFFMRKVWPHANQLYENLLSGKLKKIPLSKAEPREVEAYFDTKIVSRKVGGDGKYSPGRFPHAHISKIPITARPYTVFIGFDTIFDEFPSWLGDQADVVAHGNLFSRKGVQFAGGDALTTGNLSDNVKIRNRNPRSFLSNLIWNNRDQFQCFQFDIEDHHRVRSILMDDPNARILFIKDSWLLKIQSMRVSGENTFSHATRLQQLETEILKAKETNSNGAKLSVLELQDVMDSPVEALKSALESVGAVPPKLLPSVPVMKDLKGLSGIVRRLRNAGMDVPTLQLTKKTKDEPVKFPKPKLVKK